MRKVDKAVKNRTEKRRSRHKLWQKCVIAMASVVVFVTVYMLILPAITLESDNKELICLVEEHIHDEGCYEERQELVCGLEEGEEHTHSDECYETVTELVCGMEEHTHGDECYAPEEVDITENLSEEAAEENYTSDSDSDISYITDDEETTAFDETALPGLDGVAIYSGIVNNDSEADTEVENETENLSAAALTLAVPLPLKGEVDDHGSGEGILETILATAVDVTNIDLSMNPITYTDNGTVYSLKVCSNGFYDLVISCADNLADVTLALPSAFEAYRTQIQSLTIKDGTGTKTITVSNSGFSGCSVIEKAVFDCQDCVVALDGYAFDGCSALKDVVFTNPTITTLKTIETNVFNNCGSLKSFEWPLFGGTVGRVFTDSVNYSCKLSSIKFTRTPLTENEDGTTNAATMTSYTFYECNNLKELDLSPLENLTGFGMCLASPTGTEKIILPKNLINFPGLAFIAGDSAKNTGLKTLIFEENHSMTTFSVSNAFRYALSLPTLDLTPLKELKTVGTSYFIQAANISTIKFPASVEKLAGGTWGGTNLRNLVFEEGSQLKEIEAWVFRAGAFTSVDLSKLTNLTTMGKGVFDQCKQLTEATLAPNLTGINDTFVGCTNLKKLNLNTVNLSWCTAPFDDHSGAAGATDVTINICKNVDSISNQLFTSSKGRVSALTFEGENEFSVSGGAAETGIPAPFDTMGGDYYVSESGDLYQLFEDENGVKTATLIYKAKGETAFTLPEKVGLNRDYTVTAIGDYALKASGVVNFSFESLSSITEIDPNAFADCTTLNTIDGVNGKADRAAYLNTALGTQTINEDYFANTNLDNEIPQEGESETEVTTLGFSNEGGGSLSGNIGETGNEIQIVSSAGEKDLYTGQTEKVSLYISNKATDRVLRLYFECGGACEYPDYHTKTTVNYIDVVLKDVEGTNIHYYEIGPISADAFADLQGSTQTLSFDFVYPNLSAEGSNLKVWAASGTAQQLAAYDEAHPNEPIMPAASTGTETADDGTVTKIYAVTDEGAAIYDTYFDVTWRTQNYSHPVTKARTGNTPYLYLTEDNLAAVSGLGYVINLTNAAENVEVIEGNTNAGVLGSKPSYGSDLVKYADFDDIITLPKALYWREGVLDAVSSGNYSYDKTTGVVSVTVTGSDGTAKNYALLTLDLGDTAVSVSDVSLYVSESGQLGVKWRCNNSTLSNTDSSKVYDISSCKMTMTYGDEVILFNEEEWKKENPTEAETAENGASEGGAANTISLSSDDEIPIEYSGVMQMVMLTALIDHNVNNSVTCAETYQYGEPVSTAASAGGELTISETGGFTLEKSRTLPNNRTEGYLGEEAVYTITAHNGGAKTNTEVSYVEDKLPNAVYIKPENMDKMFEELKGDPDCNLSVTIDGLYASSAYVGLSATRSISEIQAIAAGEEYALNNAVINTVDGEEKTIYTGQYYCPTDDICYNEGILTNETTAHNYRTETKALKAHLLKFTLETDTVEEETTEGESLSRKRIKLTIYQNPSADGKTFNEIAVIYIGADTDCRFKTIKEAFDILGVVINGFNGSTRYTVRYDYRGGFAAGEIREHTVYSTVKDTLIMNYATTRYNWNYPVRQFGYRDGNWLGENTAYAYRADGTEFAHSNKIAKTGLSTELKISKAMSVNGEATAKITDGDFMDYTITINHKGTGSFDILPVTDGMDGIQAMAVGYEDNYDEVWAVDLDEDYIYTAESGKKYYILLPPKGQDSYTFKGVNVNGHYADSVSVSVTKAGGRLTNIETVTKWFLSDTYAGAYDLNIGYNAVFDGDAFMKILGADSLPDEFTANNYAFLGDRPRSRLYDCVGFGFGSFDIDKNFVSSEAGNKPSEDVVYDTDNKIYYDGYHRPTISYRLELINTDARTRTVKGGDFYDALPPNTKGNETFDFEWTPDNIELHYAYGNAKAQASYNGEVVGRTVENGSPDRINKTVTEEITDENGEVLDTVTKTYGPTGEWYVSYNNPATSGVLEKQQYICWDDDFSVTLEPDETFYIYVTLTLPIESQGDWSKYVAANGGTILENSFHWKAKNAYVRTTLLERGGAFIEKGVYDTLMLAFHAGAPVRAYERSDANTYVSGMKSDKSNHGAVFYYIVLRNSGNNKLYVHDIYDDLPKGFSFDKMADVGLDFPFGHGSFTNSWPGDTRSSGKEAANPYYECTYGYSNSISPVTVTVNDGKVVDARSSADTAIKVQMVSSETIDDHKRLTFRLSGGILEDSDHKDEHGSYLRSGEYVVFGYMVLTGTDTENKEIATNRVAMRYDDDTFLEEEKYWQKPYLDEDTIVKSKATGWAPNTTSTRNMLTNADAASYNYAEDYASGSVYWLTSDVTVTRGGDGDEAPDILKEVYDSKTAKYTSNTNITGSEEVKWRIKQYNRGTGNITNYTFKDDLEYPQCFTGTVNLFFKTDLTKINGYSGSTYYGYTTKADLFTIGERSVGDTTVTITDAYNTAYTFDLTTGEEKTIYAKIYGENGNALYVDKVSVKVSIQRIGEGTGSKEVITIKFEDEYWSIMPDCYAEINLSSQNVTNAWNPISAIYNTAAIMPANTNYDKTKIQTGSAAEGGVESWATISSDVVSPTSSSLKITVSDSEGNHTAASSDTNNSVVLADKNKEFTYTLTVKNGNQDMNKLVLIDNLPYVGDTNTLRDDVNRESEFKVRLAEEPNFTLVINKYKTETIDGTETEVPDGTLDLVYGTDYTIQYSVTKSDSFSSGSDFAGAASETDWTEWENKTFSSNEEKLSFYSGIKSLRLVINPANNVTIPANAEINFSFDANVDTTGNNDAATGEIAYNTFGYQYEFGEEGTAISLYAAPRKVGVQIPDAPYLQKRITNSQNGDITAKAERKFKFVIYEGDKVSFVDCSAETVGAALTAENRAFTVVTLTVSQGATESERLQLDSLVKYGYNAETGEFYELTDENGSIPWAWEYVYTDNEITGHSYNVVELDDSSMPYEFKYLSGYVNQQNYSFSYDPAQEMEIKFLNQRKDWNVKIYKTDEKTGDDLSGGIFGIYSPNETDALSAEQITAYKTELGVRPDYEVYTKLVYNTESGEIRVYKETDVGEELGANEKIYYLSQMMATDAGGYLTFKGLYADDYLIGEIQPPDGYYVTADQKYRYQGFSYASDVIESDMTVELELTNKPGFKLPKTGGRGSLIYAFGGAIAIGAAVLLLLNKRKIK